MKPLTLLVLAGLVNILLLNCEQKKSALTDTPGNSSRIFHNLRDDHDRQLTLRQQIGQTVILSSATIEEECQKQGKSIREFFELYPPGGIFIDHKKIWEKDSLRQLISAYREAVPYPLVICADLSSGAGSIVRGYTRFPSLTGIAATQSPRLAYGAAKVMAWEARSLDIDWVFNPGVNLIRPTVLGGAEIFTDGLSDDPLLTQWFLKEMIDGYHQNRILAIARLFEYPGYLSQANRHAQTKNTTALFDWQSDQEMILQTLIHKGITAILIAPHPDKYNIPVPLPSDVRDRDSLAVYANRLKRGMGFKGVVIRGIPASSLDRTESERIDTEWIKNGTDMVLCPSLDYYDAMERALANGTVKKSRFNDALERILILKKKTKLERVYPVPPELTREQRIHSQTLAKEIVRKSLTLIKNTPQLIPMSSGKVKSILLITNRHDHGKLISKIKNQVEIKQPKLYCLDDLPPATRYRVAESVDFILYALIDYSGNLTPKDSTSLWINKIFQSNPEKSIVISFDNPFHYHQFHNAAVYINTFNTDPSVAKPLVDALYGKVSFQGNAPVKLAEKIKD